MNYLVLASFLCFCTAVLDIAAHLLTPRMRSGKCLWAAPFRLRRKVVYLAVACAAGIGLHLGNARTDWHAAVMCWALGTSAVASVGAGLREARFEIRERGITVGKLYVGWKELLVWGWSPDGRRILHVWYTPRERWFYGAKAKQPLSTGVPWSSEVETLMEQHAPGLQRSAEVKEAESV